MMQQVNIRIDSDVKSRMEVAANRMGLGLNDVFRVFANRFAEIQGFPFELVYPYEPNYNAETRAALEDSKNKRNLTSVTRDELRKIWAA